MNMRVRNTECGVGSESGNICRPHSVYEVWISAPYAARTADSTPLSTSEHNTL